ncbi:MAG: hypothetical protein IT345_15195 [Trueperaceae bacterium]|nr:hypothetical protein [Trueperaceae bacterium]
MARTDRRETHALISKPRLLEVSMDMDTLAVEAGRRINEAWRIAEPTLGGDVRFLRAIGKAGEKVAALRVIAHSLSGAIESLPEVNPDQLEVWTRPDGAVVTPLGTAA